MSRNDYSSHWRGARRQDTSGKRGAQWVRRDRKRRFMVPSALTGLMLVGAFGFGYSTSGDSLKAMLPGSGCTIKGNISINTGERIFHVPGQRRYDETRISPQYGERWFCSEAEAHEAGWRKSRQ